MKNIRERAYFLKRGRQSRTAAASAPDISAKAAHRALAVAYDKLASSVDMVPGTADTGPQTQLTT